MSSAVCVAMDNIAVTTAFVKSEEYVTGEAQSICVGDPHMFLKPVTKVADANAQALMGAVFFKISLHLVWDWLSWVVQRQAPMAANA